MLTTWVKDSSQSWTQRPLQKNALALLALSTARRDAWEPAARNMNYWLDKGKGKGKNKGKSAEDQARERERYRRWEA